MRTAVLLMMLAVGVVVGCAADQKRIERDDRLSAARLSGKFHHDDPLVQMLSPSERQAIFNAGMMAPLPEGTEPGDVAVIDPEEDPDTKTTTDKAGEVLMSVLSVSLTLGMMAAPYLLF